MRALARLVGGCALTAALLWWDAAQVHAQPQADLLAHIDHYAAAYGADPALLRRIAFCESRLDPLAYNPVGATRGAFQWQRASWQEVAPQIGISPDFAGAWDAATSTAVSAYSLALGQRWRWKGCL